MHRGGEGLFSAYHLDQLFDDRREKLQRAIAALDPAEALRSTREQLVRRLVAEYAVAPVEFDTERESLETKETTLGDRRDRQIPAISYELRMPFGGEPKLFHCVRSGGTYRGIVQGRIEATRDGTGGALCMEWSIQEGERDQLKPTMDADIREVRHQIAKANKVVRSFNQDLEGKANAGVQVRREKVRANAEFAASLGFPLKQRDDLPPGYAVELTQREIRAVSAGAAASGPIEPFLTEGDYDAVLGALMGMSVAMERSPRAFRAMQEEELRFVLLIPLNVMFKGAVVGEAFNYQGKTDILLHADGRPVFIAECMIWDGPHSLKEKLEQLRGYATWRDTKLALVVFSRRGGFTDVLHKIRTTLPEAPGVARIVEYGVATGYRCIIRHRDDPDRELVLSVLAFDVPGPD